MVRILLFVALILAAYTASLLVGPWPMAAACVYIGMAIAMFFEPRPVKADTTIVRFAFVLAALTFVFGRGIYQLASGLYLDSAAAISSALVTGGIAMILQLCELIPQCERNVAAEAEVAVKKNSD